MSQFTISAQELSEKKETLSALKTTLETQVAQLESIGKSLNTMWEGPARESYARSLSIDLAKVKVFLKILGEFINILTKIISLYKIMEKKNVATAAG